MRIRYYSEDYTYAEAESDFQYALGITNSDSLMLKAQILNSICQFDTLTSLGKEAGLLLDSMLFVRKKQITSEITGLWEWAWDGSNWGTESTPEKSNCSRQLLITADTLYFYENNILQKKSACSVIVRPVHYKLTDHCIMHVEGEKYCKVISTSDDPGYYYAMKKSVVPLRFLHINHQYMCVCGCPTSVYYRKKE